VRALSVRPLGSPVALTATERETSSISCRFRSLVITGVHIRRSACSAGFLPTACAEFDVVWKYLLPIGATLFLLEADLSSLLSSGTAVLVAYAVGVAGTVVGTLVAWMLVGK
jgi:uncharacterized membrane protein